MRTANPALTADTFTDYQWTDVRSDRMTINGTASKTLILLLLALLTAGLTWGLYFKSGGNPAAVTPWLWVGIIGGAVASIATIFKKTWAPITAPLYALLEGLFIGALSAIIESAYPGIVMQASALTFGTLGFMLVAYKTGLVKATEGFKMGVLAATGGIGIVYFVSIILSFFGVHVPFIYGGGVFGIGFSLFVVFIAALNLVLDFDAIQQGARQGAPKYMEWYGAFALMVTLIWLYIEILRLLSKMRER